MSEADGDWPDLAGRMDGRIHVLPVRVYYEDTDFSGLVYHANYLKFCERGRSDFLRKLGIFHRVLHERAQEDRASFVVRRMMCAFLKPAMIDDIVEVETAIADVRGARLNLIQTVKRRGEALFEATVEAALIDGTGRPKRFAGDIKTVLCEYITGTQ